MKTTDSHTLSGPPWSVGQRRLPRPGQRGTQPPPPSSSAGAFGYYPSPDKEGSRSWSQSRSGSEEEECDAERDDEIMPLRPLRPAALGGNNGNNNAHPQPPPGMGSPLKEEGSSFGGGSRNHREMANHRPSSLGSTKKQASSLLAATGDWTKAWAGAGGNGNPARSMTAPREEDKENAPFGGGGRAASNRCLSLPVNEKTPTLPAVEKPIIRERADENAASASVFTPGRSIDSAANESDDSERRGGDDGNTNDTGGGPQLLSGRPRPPPLSTASHRAVSPASTSFTLSTMGVSSRGLNTSTAAPSTTTSGTSRTSGTSGSRSALLGTRLITASSVGADSAVSPTAVSTLVSPLESDAGVSRYGEGGAFSFGVSRSDGTASRMAASSAGTSGMVTVDITPTSGAEPTKNWGEADEAALPDAGGRDSGRAIAGGGCEPSPPPSSVPASKSCLDASAPNPEDAALAAVRAAMRAAMRAAVRVGLSSDQAPQSKKAERDRRLHLPLSPPPPEDSSPELRTPKDSPVLQTPKVGIFRQRKGSSRSGSVAAVPKVVVTKSADEVDAISPLPFSVGKKMKGASDKAKAPWGRKDDSASPASISTTRGSSPRKKLEEKWGAIAEDEDNVIAVDEDIVDNERWGQAREEGSLPAERQLGATPPPAAVRGGRHYGSGGQRGRRVGLHPINRLGGVLGKLGTLKINKVAAGGSLCRIEKANTGNLKR